MRFTRRGIVLVLALGALAPPVVAGAASDQGADAVERAAVHDAGRLVPEMVDAFREAREAGRAAGVELEITSGYRTPEEQEALFLEAIETYGSVEEASRWVLPPDETNHVRGTAIDVGPPEAAAWLEEHGAAFGLCRTYENEWWHFELTPDAATTGSCPPMAPTA